MGRLRNVLWSGRGRIHKSLPTVLLLKLILQQGRRALATYGARLAFPRLWPLERKAQLQDVGAARSVQFADHAMLASNRMITLILVSLVFPEPDGMFLWLVCRTLVFVRVEWVLAFCHDYIGQRTALRVNYYADRN